MCDSNFGPTYSRRFGQNNGFKMVRGLKFHWCSQSEENDEFEENSEEIRREMTRYLRDSSFSSRFNFPTTSVLDSKRIFEKIPIRSSKISGTREIFFNRRQILRTKRLSLMPKNFESCLFLKKNLGIFGEDFGACPNEFEAPPPAPCPSATAAVPSHILFRTVMLGLWVNH